MIKRVTIMSLDSRTTVRQGPVRHGPFRHGPVRQDDGSDDQRPARGNGRRLAAGALRVTGRACRTDPIRLVLWAAGVVLAAATTAIMPGAATAAARATLGPFATLAAIILGSVLADRLGVFAALGRALIPSRCPARVTAAAIMSFTALLSALVNLDVAVVVAMPIALSASRRGQSGAWHGTGLSAGRLALSVAATANAASFLLPTSNITNLLLLGRVHLGATAYIGQSWLPWLLVTAITVAVLAIWSAGQDRRAAAQSRDEAAARPPRLSAGMLSDLVALFAIAAGVRALLGTALGLHGSLVAQLGYGSAVASIAGNLPAAAALLPAGTTGLWAAVLATTIGPNLLITGSVATLISRRIASDGGAKLSIWQFSAMGLALVPVQFAVAALGLHITGGLP